MSLVTMKAQLCTAKVTSVIMHENSPKEIKRNPPSRWHYGNSEEQKIYTPKGFVLSNIYYTEERIS